MIFAPRRVLVVAPHTDDMELCCGGTVAKMVQQGVTVSCLAFSTASHLNLVEGESLVLAEYKLAAEVLGVKLLIQEPEYAVRTLSSYRQSVLDELLVQGRLGKYDLVIGPSTRDTHQDHEVVAKEIFRAFKDMTILAWEAPWNNLSSNLNMFVSLTEQQVEKKLKAVRCYDSQHTVAREYFTPDYLTSWARMRGGQVGYKYAEAFEIVRMKI